MLGMITLCELDIMLDSETDRADEDNKCIEVSIDIDSSNDCIVDIVDLIKYIHYNTISDVMCSGIDYERMIIYYDYSVHHPQHKKELYNAVNKYCKDRNIYIIQHS